MFRWATVASSLLVVGLFTLGVMPADAATTTTSSTASRFCTKLTAAGSFPAALTTAEPSTAAATAKRLSKAESVAPRSVKAAAHTIVDDLDTLAATHKSSARATLVTKRSAAYVSAIAKLTAYTSKYCPAPLPTSPALPGVLAAQETACLADAATIRAVEDIYVLLNGSYASMADLVASRLLARVSSFYTDVQVGTPPGGYLLVADPKGPCANVPVARSA